MRVGYKKKAVEDRMRLTRKGRVPVRYPISEPSSITPFAASVRAYSDRGDGYDDGTMAMT